MNKVLKSLMKSHTSLIKSKESLEKSLKMEREDGLGFIGVGIFERAKRIPTSPLGGKAVPT